jgi:cell volume regulation protein A
VSIEQLDVALLVGAAVLLVAVAAVRVSVGTGTPSLLLYLALGVGIGDAGIGLHYEDYELTAVLGYCALVLILTEGGLTTAWPTIRSVIAPAAVLATLGTAVSVVVVGLVTHWLLDLPIVLAMLLGAIVSSTDAAAVFSVMRTVRLPRRLTGLLEAESGFNDAPAVITVVALTESLAGGAQEPAWQLVLVATGELAGGAAVGLAVGWLGARGLRSVALPSPGLYPIAVLALCVLAYGGAARLHLSGFIAVYLAALVLGNSRLPHRHVVRSFAEGMGWLSQIGLFVLLGLLVDPALLLPTVLPALVVGAVLLLLARPLSVVASMVWFRVPVREQVLVSWGGLRGAVPIVLATIPALADVPGSRGLVEEVFILVVVFTLVQAPTLPALARYLRLDDDLAHGLDVDAAPLGALDADVLQVHVGPTSRLHGLQVFELRLPAGADVTLVVRDGTSLVPEPRTLLRHGDDLLVVAVAAVRDAAESRLRAVDEGGRLAQWRPRGGQEPAGAPPAG